jgi:hypothetical protein
MTPFRRVDAQHAGPKALGILVPPGRHTLVILRPRGLEWDLVPARWNGNACTPPVFCRFSRDEAAGVARRLQHALEQAIQGDSPVQTVGDAKGQRFQVWLRTAEFVWVLCPRIPGQPYQPLHFASLDEATGAAERLEPYLWPDLEANQEYYFNTQNFSGS